MVKTMSNSNGMFVLLVVFLLNAYIMVVWKNSSNRYKKMIPLQFPDFIQKNSGTFGQKQKDLLSRFDQTHQAIHPITQNTGSCGFVYPDKMHEGRTGDQISIVIGSYLLARDSNRAFVYPYEWRNNLHLRLLDGFHLIPNLYRPNISLKTLTQGSQEYPTSRTLVVIDSIYAPMGPHLNFPCHSNLTITGGFLPAPLYFVFHENREHQETRDIVKSVFKFKDNILLQTRRRIAEALKQLNCDKNCKCGLIAAHTRRTDAVHNINTTNLHRYPLRQFDRFYIQMAYEQIKNELLRRGFPCIVLLLVSDDFSWTKDNQPIGDRVLTLNTSSDPLIDFCLLASSDGVITTNGNFGYFGAYLSGGLVTYPANQRNMFSPLSNWIPIDPCPKSVSEPQRNKTRVCFPATQPFNVANKAWLTNAANKAWLDSNYGNRTIIRESINSGGKEIIV